MKKYLFLLILPFLFASCNDAGVDPLSSLVKDGEYIVTNSYGGQSLYAFAEDGTFELIRYSATEDDNTDSEGIGISKGTYFKENDQYIGTMTETFSYGIDYNNDIQFFDHEYVSWSGAFDFGNDYSTVDKSEATSLYNDTVDFISNQLGYTVPLGNFDYEKVLSEETR